VGRSALRESPGSYNFAGGYQSSYRSGGTSNLFLGANAAYTSTGTNYYTNAIAIGTGSIPLGNNSMVLGNAQTATTEIKGNVGIGTNTPAASLDVNGSAIIRTNLTVNGVITGNMDAYRTPYSITTYSSSTVTVLRAYGDSVALELTNNCTITFNMAEWPTNNMACLALSLHPNGYSTTFDTSCISANGATNTVPGSAGLALQTNTWNLLTFVHAYGWTNWGVRQ